MKSFYRYCIYLVIFIGITICPKQLYAGNAAGGELLFQWLHDSTYQFYFKFYRDCSGPAEPDSVSLCYRNSCNSSSGSVWLNKMTGYGGSVSTGCTNIQTKCTNPSVTLIGYWEWYYTGTITLPLKCNYWTFSVSVNSRNNAITNLVSPGSQYLYTEATLDNLDAQGDTSPFFSRKPVYYACTNIPYTYNQGAYDINNDSLAFTLIQPLSGSGCPASTSAISFQTSSPAFDLDTVNGNPLQCNNSFNFNTHTGIMSFTPTDTQAAVIAIRVDEYRNNIKIGSVIRNMEVYVKACNVGLPIVTFAGFSGCYILPGSVSADALTIISVPGAHLSFNVTAIGVPSTEHIVLTDNSFAVFSYNLPVISYLNQLTDTVNWSFLWLPTIGDTGIHILNFIVNDSNCTAGLGIPYDPTVVIKILPGYYNNTNYCTTGTLGGIFDTSDIGRFIIGTNSFGTIYSHLSNPAAVNSYTLHPDTINLFIDSAYHLQEAGIMNTIHDADAKLTLFIDFNNNQQFDIPQERVWTAYQKAFYSYIVDTSITIPATAVTDVPIMMRLILNNNTGASAASDSACGPYISGETEDFIVVFRNAATAIKNLNNDKTISFYPNPSSGKFIMKLNSSYGVQQLQLTVYSITGQKIISKEFNNTDRRFSTGIDLSAMPKGLYFIETNADGERQLNKIVLE